MKKNIINIFDLKRKKHPYFGLVYEYVFQKRSWVKDENALIYTLIDIERWAKEMQKIVQEESGSNPH